MKRTTKNEKVIRAITIGLATMIAATSAPLDVLASEEGEQNHEASENTNESEDNQEVTEDVNDAEEHIENAEAIIEGGNYTEPEAPSVETPSVETPSVETPAVDTTADAPVVDAVTPDAPAADEVTADGAAVIADESLNLAKGCVPAIEQTIETVQILEEANVLPKADPNEAVAGETTALQDLNAAKVLLVGDDGAKANLETAKAALTGVGGAEEKLKDLNIKADNVEAKLNNTTGANNSLNIFDTASGETDADAKETIEIANKAINIANSVKDAKSLDDAKNIKTQAENKLHETDADLEEVSEAYDKASKDVDEAKLKLTLAQGDLKDAKDKLQEASDAVKSAQGNATACQERLKAAEAKVRECTKEVEDQAQRLEDLKAIKNQLDAMTLQSYLIKGGYVFNQDGTLDLKSSAEKVDLTKVNGTSDEKEKLLGRDLLRKIVTYMIKNDPNVDFEKSQFTFGDGNDKNNYQPAYEGKIFKSGTDRKDKDGKDVKGKGKGAVGTDQVVINTERGYVIKTESGTEVAQDKIQPNEDTGFVWAALNCNRTNRVHVHYIDRKGVGHDEYYNYVFKNTNDENYFEQGKTYKDDEKRSILSLENGFVYLAKIEPVYDENGNIKLDKNRNEIWTATKVNDRANNFLNDNYDELVKALADAQAAADKKAKYESEYQKVLAEFANAEGEVEKLQKELANIQIKIGDIRVREKKVAELESKLAEANTRLETAGKNKENLEILVEEARNLVEEARNAVQNIKLPEFKDPKAPRTPVNPGTPGTPAAPAPAAADTTAATDDDDDDDAADVATGDAATGEGFTYDLGSASTSIPTYDISSTGAPVDAAAFDDAGTFGDAGVLGARVPEGGSTGGDANGAGLENNGGIAPVANFNTVKKVLGAKTPVVGKKNNKKGVRVADPVTPLAAMPEEDGFSMNWWWLLVIALLGATGKKMYDEHKKKVEAREQAKNNIND